MSKLLSLRLNLSNPRPLAKSQQAQRRRFYKNIAAGFGLTSVILLGIGLVSHRSTNKLLETANQVEHTQDVIQELEELLSQIKDAETGQRGYIITGKKSYLEPYYTATTGIKQDISELRQLTNDTPSQQRRLVVLELLTTKKLEELKQMIALRQNQGFAAASQIVMTDRGKNLMEDIRKVVREMQNTEKDLLTQHLEVAAANAHHSMFIDYSGILLDFFILTAVYYCIYREFNQRQRAELALQQSENKYRYVVDNVKEVIFQTDATGLWTFLNPAWTEITGFSIEESLGSFFLNYIHPDDRQRSSAWWRSLIERQKECCKHEARFLTKNGGFRWIEIYARLTVYPEDNTVGTSGTLIDITDCQWVEKELVRRESYWAALVELQRRLLSVDGDKNNATQILAPLGQVSGASRVYLFKNHRDPAGSLLTSQLAEWYGTDIYFESDRPQCSHFSNNNFPCRWAEVLAQGQIISGTIEEFPSDEQTLLAAQGIKSILILPLTVNGKLFGFISFDNCVEAKAWESSEVDFLLAAASFISLWQERYATQLAYRKSEQRLSLHIQQTPIAVIEWNLDFEITEWNPAAERIFGYSKDEIIGGNPFELLVPEHIKEQAEKVREDLLMLKNGNRSTNENLTKDGRIIICEWYNTPLIDSNGDMIGVASLAQDITERKQAEAELRWREEFLSRLISSSADCIKVLDLEGRLLFMNTGGQVIMEIEDFTPYQNSSWVEFWQQIDREVVSAAIAEAKTLGLSKFQGYCPTAKGKQKWWEVTLTPIMDAEGKPEKILVVSRDITERKQAEAALRESEERFKAFMNNSPAVVAMKDEEGRYVYINQQMERCFNTKLIDWLVHFQ